MRLEAVETVSLTKLAAVDILSDTQDTAVDTLLAAQLTASLTVDTRELIDDEEFVMVLTTEETADDTLENQDDRLIFSSPCDKRV
jgi:hypothetical protein